MNKTHDISESNGTVDHADGVTIEREGEPCAEAGDARESDSVPVAVEYLCREWGAVGRAILLRRAQVRSSNGSQDESGRVHPRL